MSKKLPYLASPGSIATALDRIAKAATPPKVTNDFVTTKLQIKGGTGKQITPFLKKIGFVGTDGSPTTLYTQFRNPSSSAETIAAAVRHGYAPLYEVNEYAHNLEDEKLKGLILQVTDLAKDDKVAGLIHSTYKKLAELADFESDPSEKDSIDEGGDPETIPNKNSSQASISASMKRREVGLSYTINLNLPSTSNMEVYNAIFKSLKEHLLSD